MGLLEPTSKNDNKMTNQKNKLESPYQHYIIIRKFVKKGRFYVRLNCHTRTETIPYANYIWLVGNPAFSGIPKEYIVHHLDNDPLNNDISNLSLMAKNHHRAYHLKHRNVDTPIEEDFEIDNTSTIHNLPMTRPRVHYKKDRDSWHIYYRMRENGKGKAYFLSNYKGRYFRTKEQAEEAIKKIWPVEWIK